MRRDKKRPSQSADRLIEIIKSVIGVSPRVVSSKPDHVLGRAIFYKIFQKTEGWPLIDLGSQFKTNQGNRHDHSTVHNALSMLNDIMASDKIARSQYERCMSMYLEIENVEWDFELSKRDLAEEVSKQDCVIKSLNAYIRLLEKELSDLNHG